MGTRIYSAKVRAVAFECGLSEGLGVNIADVPFRVDIDETNVPVYNIFTQLCNLDRCVA